MLRFLSFLLSATIFGTFLNFFVVCDYELESVSTKYTPIHETGRCSIRGTCKRTTLIANEPCVYNGLAEPIEDDEAALTILRFICPMYFENNTNPAVCCDAAQVTALKKSMSVPAQLLTRCQPCFSNFLEIWCAYTCDPNQSQFVDVTKADLYNKDGKIVESASNMDVYFDQTFADDMYTSCKDVQFPGSNQKAMDLLCGTNVENCSPQVFLNYLGSKSNGQSPVQLNFILVNDSIPVPESNYILFHYKSLP